MSEQAIVGYRTLTKDETELINELKTQGNALGTAIDAMSQIDSVDQRWLSIGRTHMQQGLMALVRAVAKPASF